jgi:hypothetical protein
VWFLRDAELEGRLWNDYADGNVLGYWLAPRLRVFLNGSLNVPKSVMRASMEIRAGAGGADASLTETLDRYGIDVFLGTGLPVVPGPRSAPATTTRLEGAPDWLLVFRSPRSAVYLRRDPRNAANLERVAAYYRRERVPFDPQRGFDAEAVISGAPRWALEHGLVPVRWRALEATSGLVSDPRRRLARDRVAETWALLGAYERAVAIDRQQLGAEPDADTAARRLVWSLLHLDRFDEALAAAERWLPPEDGSATLSALLASEARRLAAAPAGARAVPGLPLLAHWEAQRALSGLLAADARPAPER